MYYTKKPVTIEAFQWFGDQRQSEDPPWIVEAMENGIVVLAKDEPALLIVTLEGTMTANQGDYIIKGIKGELYPCKPDIFEASYNSGGVGEQVNCLDIGKAVNFLRQGRKVRRKGWNGAGMWIVFMDELKLPPFSDQTTNRKVNDRTAKHIGEDTEFHSLPYIAMWTAQGKWQPGWVCSQADLLANDWELAD